MHLVDDLGEGVGENMFFRFCHGETPFLSKGWRGICYALKVFYDNSLEYCDDFS